MSVSLEVAERPRQATTDFDAVIIGAGISGMFTLYRLRELGMTARVFETGTSVGGTCIGTVTPAPFIPRAGPTATPSPRS